MMDPRKIGQFLMGEWNKTEQPLEERAGILPIGKYQDGSVGMAWPGIIADPAKRVGKALGAALTGDQSYYFGDDGHLTNDAIMAGIDATGLAMTGGLGAGLVGGFADNAVGSAGSKLTKAATDLPMDLASRMARAKEMGFDTDVTAYHGTPDSRDIWKNGFQTLNQRYGKDDPNAVYFFADEKRVADTYADDRRAFDYQNAEPETIPVHLRMKDPAVINWGGRKFRGKEQNEQGYNIHDLIDQARAAGNDGFIINNVVDTYNATGRPSTIRGVFDPRNIRSVNAAFDPSKSDSANLLAANAKTGAAVPLAMNTLEKQSPQGIRAYHGSPHDFDKFSLDKIGTGEGAQAYGHGMYFADSEDVARSYRDKLGGLRSGFEINGRQYDPIGGTKETAKLAAAENIDPAVAREVLAYHDMTPDQMIADVQRFPSGERDANILAAAEWKRSNDIKAGGRMYEVNIRANPEDFLDWDKPLSQQSEAVRRAIEQVTGKKVDPDAIKAYNDALYSALFDDAPAPLPREPWDITGASLYNMFGAGKAGTTQALREAGIPGIRYLDGMSRGAGEGSSNYVVFDDQIVDILRKYANAPTGAVVPAGLEATDQDTDLNPVLLQYLKAIGLQ